MHDYDVLFPVYHEGRLRAAGEKIRMSGQQAKYPLLAGRVRPSSSPRRGTKKRSTKKETHHGQ